MIAYIKDTITEVTVNDFIYKDGSLKVLVTVKHNGMNYILPADQIILWG